MMKLRRLAIILPLVALLSSIDKINIINNSPHVFVSANIPPSTSSRGGRFGRKRNKQRSSSDASDGLTLGDLEALQQQSTNNGGGTFIPAEAILSQPTGQSQQIDPTDEESSEQTAHQLRRSLRRINLDLSGRVMCHVLSPRMQNDDDNDRPAIQMNSIPLFEVSSPQLNCNKKTLHRIQRHIPHVYLGANYDLDEVWYGATRWIAKCSWSLPKKQSTINYSRTTRQLVKIIFPTTTASRSAWMFDLEREQSVFENSDTTTRASLVQQSLPSAVVQKLSLEYDSAKYSSNRIDNAKTLVQAPAISVNVQTPILHPRIELRMKRTWVVQKSGDNHGNYYGGAFYSSVSPIEQRLESIREGYRAMIPRSQFSTEDSDPTASSTSSAKGRLQTFGRKLSNWLEEDGWMPKRVTTNLMGNFVSINEVGFSSASNSETNSDKHSHSFLPSRDNMGLRLRISKRIDWTSLGIFPWSSNNPNRNQNSNHAPTTPTFVRFDLCGLHNSGNTMSQIGCEFDPLCLGNTFKLVIGHDAVGAD